jgi:hypothetical protein
MLIEQVQLALSELSLVVAVSRIFLVMASSGLLLRIVLGIVKAVFETIVRRSSGDGW